MRTFLVCVLAVLAGCGSAAELGDNPLDTALTNVANGSTGPTGPAGATISSNTRCSKIDSGLMFDYLILRYTSGDVFVDCSISDSSATYSRTAFFKAGQTGATTYSCLLTYDVDASSSGYWTFNYGSSVYKATYSDSGSASNNFVLTYASGDCTTL